MFLETSFFALSFSENSCTGKIYSVDVDDHYYCRENDHGKDGDDRENHDGEDDDYGINSCANKIHLKRRLWGFGGLWCYPWILNNNATASWFVFVM